MHAQSCMWHVPAIISDLQLSQVTRRSPRTFITTDEGQTIVFRSSTWSPLHHGQWYSLFLRLSLRQAMQTRVLHVVSWIGRSTTARHSWHTKSSVDKELVCDRSVKERASVVTKKLGGAMLYKWVTADRALPFDGRHNLLLSRAPATWCL